MTAPAPVSCPEAHSPESLDLRAPAPRQRSVRYPKESHHPHPQDPKPLPRSCKAHYTSPKMQEPSHHLPDVELEPKVEENRYSNEAKTEVEDHRPASPSSPENEQEDHHHEEDHDQADFNGGADSLDDDSSSEYMNNTSEDEEDYDDGGSFMNIPHLSLSLFN